MRKFGLIGYPLSHSFSQKYFTEKFEKEGLKWFQSTCSPQACELLEGATDDMFPNKDAPIIVYCRSGRRASKAKEILENKGYKNVLNAGGYDDIAAMGI